MLVVADFANIEGRVLAWVAGAEDTLSAYRAYDLGIGPDIYKTEYAKAFGITTDKVGSKERTIGKVINLALGYQGWTGAFDQFAKVYGVKLPEKKVEEIITKWRIANPEIVDLWAALDDKVRAVIKTGKTRKVGRLTIGLKKGFLVIVLPSGNTMTYYDPRIVPDAVRGSAISYMGILNYKWTRLKSYGGKLTENIIQSIARDILAEAMLRVDEYGFLIVGHVHDEIITDGVKGDLKGLIKVMIKSPDWAEGIPLAAEGYEDQRYRK